MCEHQMSSLSAISWQEQVIFDDIIMMSALYLTNTHVMKDQFQTKHIKSITKRKKLKLVWLVGFMVFDATFNNILALSWQSVILVEETRVPGENH